MRTIERQVNTEAPVRDDQRTFTPPDPKPGYELGKRIFDIGASLIALVVLSPVLLLVCLAIWLEDGGSPIYSQIRLTKGGKEFRMYKFRSMCKNADQMLDSLMQFNEIKGPAFKIKADPRITKVGGFLRKTSIDELPQLVNIIKGDMSIIGPRPPLPREVEQYTPYQLHRLDVKTGLACYHECMGRSDANSFDEWVESDLRYIRERSFRTDLKIIWWTIKVVVTRKGAM